MPAIFPLERYLNIRSAHDPSFSPDGRFVAFLSNTTGVAQVWQAPVEGGWPDQLTFSGETVRSVHYHPHRHELIYAMDAGGNERMQLFRLHGGDGDALSGGLDDGWTSDDVSNSPEAIHYFGGYSHDGARFAFSANRDDPVRFDIFVQPLDGGEPAVVARGPGGFYTPAGWSPDDSMLLVQHTESNTREHLHLIDVASGRSRLLAPAEGDALFNGVRWSADGKAVYCATTAGGRDLAGLAAIDVATGAVTYLQTPPHEVESAYVSQQGRWLAWLLNVDGRSELWLRDLRRNADAAAAGLPLGVITSVAFSRDDAKIAVSFDGPRHNLDVWVADLTGDGPGEWRQLTHAGRAGLPFSRFVEPERIAYRTFDGREIPAWFYAPSGAREGLPPVIVYPHGGPEAQTRPNFNALFQYLITAGYAVLAPNVRGSTGYGTAFMNLDNTTKRMDSVADLAHAAYWLRDHGRGDPERLAVFGGSYGGFMVLAQVTNYPELWAAGVDVVGVCNFVTFLENTGPFRRAHRESEYGSLEWDRAFLEKISPIHHIDRIRCPMMVVHGANDVRVPVSEAEQIVAALRKRNVPVEYLRYEDEGHGILKLRNRLDYYPKMVAFLDRHLRRP